MPPGAGPGAAPRAGLWLGGTYKKEAKKKKRKPTKQTDEPKRSLLEARGCFGGEEGAGFLTSICTASPGSIALHRLAPDPGGAAGSGLAVTPPVEPNRGWAWG